ncbi:sensor histidine kinase [Algoriphagus hitonicola]|uniref:Histidine kinase n=1 Tax=Algoriphagus hitonicola TaxID=435880 RepID=A0A1I2TUG1_9BACT|nr:histidine kinase [Algoriphagus hitonicola]SFG67849.1 Histidine kinase [Algoriphagus hitonicola]
MFGHRYKFLFPGLLGLYSFFNILILDGDRLFQASLPESQLFVLIIILSYGIWMINWAIELLLIKNFPKTHPLVVQFIASAAAMAMLAQLSMGLSGVLFGGPFGLSSKNFLLTFGFLSRLNLFLNCLNAIYFFSQKLNEKQLETEKLKLLGAEAKLESINSQLNPHFFFNNLSALSVLIHQNVDQADQYLQKLSLIYRYILNNKINELVSLEEELSFLQNYLDLLQIRFQDSLSFSMSIDQAVRTKMIPPAVLQILVENVVKHNFFTLKNPLQIQIQAAQNTLSVKNNIQPKKPIEGSTGIGLQNISDRYKFLNQSIIIHSQGGVFEVVLPLIDGHETTVSRG